MPRRSTFSATATTTALATATAALVGGLLAPYAAAAGAQQRAPLPEQKQQSLLPEPSDGASGERRQPDRLTFTVKDTGDRSLDGTYRLECNPTGGDHPDAKGACDALERAGAHGGDPFRPVGEGSKCTRIYGGPATAHIVGEWHGRSINARFSRTDGCEIDRWNKLVPALPKSVSAG